MAPEARRAAIIAATVPLLHEHGLAISTRQIAAAAGVAEGTLFGVFPDKGALIRAALISTFDPAEAIRALQSIDPDAALRDRMVTALEILQKLVGRKTTLLGAMRAYGPHAKPSGESTQDMHEFFGQLKRWHTVLVGALAAVIEPDRAHLRHRPETVAHLVFMLMMTKARGILGEAEPMDSRMIVELLLDGVLLPSGAQPVATGPAEAGPAPRDQAAARSAALDHAAKAAAPGQAAALDRATRLAAQDERPHDALASVAGQHQRTHTHGERPA